MPTFLQVDYRNTPSVGVSRNPSFSWVVPHLPPTDGCDLVSQTNQLQHSYHLQLILAHGTVAETLVHDSGRLLDNRSINLVLGPAPPALLAGTSYTWRLPGLEFCGPRLVRLGMGDRQDDYFAVRWF